MTTSRALYSMMLLLTKHPEIQHAIQEEIDTVIGTRQPLLDDRENCPVTESMVMELLRYISHIPLAIPHMATSDTTLGGYHIPAGTQVCANLFALHHSSFWDDPYAFKPSRFLDENNNLISRDDPRRKK